MEAADVARAVEVLRAQGIPLAAITAPKVREVLSFGSFRDITKHLRALKGEEPEEEDDAPSHRAEEAYAPDTLDKADAALEHAQAQVAALEAQRPSLEEVLQTARQQVLDAALCHLTTSYAVTKGLLPGDDPLVHEADAGLWGAKRALQQAQQGVETWPAQMAQAQAAVQVAQQQAWLARERPELLDALASIQAEEPTDSQDPGESYRARSLWRQQVTSVRAQMAQVLQEAGL